MTVALPTVAECDQRGAPVTWPAGRIGRRVVVVQRPKTRRWHGSSPALVAVAPIAETQVRILYVDPCP